MKQKGKKYVGVFICILGIILLGYQLIFNKLPDETAYLCEDRDKQWVKDIEYLETALPKVHKNLYFKQDEAYFMEQLESLKEKVPQYTDEEINFSLSKIVASMGDTHTIVNMGIDKMYPLSLFWYDEGIYIVDASEAYKELLYSKVISINNKPIEEVAEAFKPFFTGANEQWFKNQVMYYITSEALLKYVGMIEEDEITLKVEKSDGNIEEIDMLPINYDSFKYIEDKSLYKIPFYQTNPNENYWYEYLEESKTLYVCYRRASQMVEKPFEIFTEEVFEVAEANDVEKMVIDVRQNQGGSDLVFKPFLKKLKKSNLNEEGKLYVIMGRKTYSAGLNTVINLKKQTEATLVGEAAGGQPNHYGDTRYFKLPNSQITVNYSTKYIKKWDEDIEIFAPDVEIAVSGELESIGRDSVMEWIEANH